MNPKKDRWESYTDKAGRRHWRWPAVSAVSERNGLDAAPAPRSRTGVPSSWPATFTPLLARGK
jgi:hypothetical protein